MPIEFTQYMTNQLRGAILRKQKELAELQEALAEWKARLKKEKASD